MEVVDKTVVQNNTTLISLFYGASIILLYYSQYSVLNSIHIQMHVKRTTILKSVAGMLYNNKSQCGVFNQTTFESQS